MSDTWQSDRTYIVQNVFVRVKEKLKTFNNKYSISICLDLTLCLFIFGYKCSIGVSDEHVEFSMALYNMLIMYVIQITDCNVYLNNH